MEVTNEQIALLISQRKLERELNENLSELGVEQQLTVSEATRFLRDNPELLKIVDDFIDNLNNEQRK